MNETIEGQVYESKTKYDSNSGDNFTVGNELLVTVTLKEYRELIRKAVHLDDKGLELYNKNKELEKLQKEHEALKSEHEQLLVKHADLVKHYEMIAK